MNKLTLMIVFMTLIMMMTTPVVYATPHENQVTMCHMPPGNPNNAHTIHVDESAVQAHLNIGDTIGACEESPIECDPPQILQDGICVNPPVVCELPEVLVDGQCITPPIECELPEILVDGQCITPPIVCEEPQILVDGVCVDPPITCEDPEILVDGVCVTPPLVCEEGQVLQDGVCVDLPPICEEPQILVDGECVTPQVDCDFPQILEDGVCVNPPDETPTCEYPQVLENDVCVNPEQPPVILDDNIHHGCPNDCTAPTFGKLPSHRQFITGGLGINGHFYNVGDYFQEIPKIKGNVTSVFLKVYENSGVQSLDTVVLATGLTPDQYVGEGLNNVVIKFNYNGTFTTNGDVVALNDGVFTYIFIQLNQEAGEKIGIQAYDLHLNVKNNFFLLK
jgi:hypothetical protein